MVERAQRLDIPFIDLAAQRRRLGDRIDAAIGRVLDHGKFILGPEVAQLEEELGAFCGAQHVVSCANGTDALVLAMMGVGGGTTCRRDRCCIDVPDVR